MKNMKPLKKLIPEFWNQGFLTDNHWHTTLNFRRKWKLIVLFTTLLALTPLVFMSLVEYKLTRQVIVDEVKSSLAFTLDSAAVSFSYSPDPKTAAMAYIAEYHSINDTDLILVTEKGLLLTPSSYFGNTGTSVTISTDSYKEKTGMNEDFIRTYDKNP